MWDDVEVSLRLPAYKMSYIGGKAQIEQLIAERVIQLGTKFNLRDFMDNFFSAGMIPISLLRWELTGLDARFVNCIKIVTDYRRPDLHWANNHDDTNYRCEEIIMRAIILIFSCMVTIANLFAQAGDKRPMTVDDALNIVRVGEIQPDESGYSQAVVMSPDGKLVLYSEGRVDWENNRFTQNAHIVKQYR